MITTTLQFGAEQEQDSEDEGMSLPTRQLSIDEARELIAVCQKFDCYVFIDPEQITIENHTLGCWTEFHGTTQEIALIASSLAERLPPPLHSHSHWLDHAGTGSRV